MQTVDMHVHLLNPSVRFDRFYDKLALKIIGKKFGIDYNVIKLDPYKAYKQALVNGVRESNHISHVALFGVDSKVDFSGKEIHRDKTVCAMNEDVYNIYMENKDIIIPFFSINPQRLDALDLIDKYSELGFKGAKFLQNYWGVDTRDKKYSKYFQKLSDKKIPLIVHIGSESSVHSVKSCESIEMLDAPIYHGVSTIAAHMAIDYSALRIHKALSKKPRNFNSEYYTLLELLEVHPNLFADISALLTPVRAKVLPHLAKESNIHHKLLFATDFPVPFDTIFNSYDLSYKKRIELNKIKNPFDRYAKSILEYFPANSDIYTNWQKLF
ncbi:MAG: amidohydrolase family protein [Sulfurovaceae bacterium]|nr:amidohydrolase family protein [Sulfurovaceae bacterium]